MFKPDSLQLLGGAALLAAPDSSAPNRACFSSEAGEISITAFAPGVFRLTLGDTALPDYGIVVGAEQALSLSVEDCGEAFVCTAQGHSLCLEKDSLAVSLRRADETLIPVTEDAHFVRRFRLPPLARTENGWFMSLGLPFGQAVYGGGEDYGHCDRRGLLMDLWDEDALGVNSSLSYKNCPFLWSPGQGGGAWGVFVNTGAYMRFGVGYPQWSNQSLCVDLFDRKLDVFFIAAPSPAGILKKYTDLTGRSDEAPLWSLGLWLSKAYYKTPAETLEAAKGMRDKGIPCDVITIDGRAWQDTDTRFLFEWDPSRYDDPKAFCDKLKALNYKICVWEYPLVSMKNPRYQEMADKGYFLKDKDGKPFRFEFDPGPFGQVLTQLPDSGVLDFTNPEAYAFWKDMHRTVFEAGVDSIKADFAEQVLPGMYAANGDEGMRFHNAYALLYNLCVYEASREYHGKNALNWSRAGWAGSQRAPMQWAGDTGSSWSGLAASIMGGLSWGMSGCPYYSTDIGGFYGEQPSPELFIRWSQAAVFCSHMRYHGIGPREPWAYGAEAESICREFIDLRYRLIPYLQECCRAASETGLPVMRSMVLSFPDEQALHPFDMQYMLGDDIFVAPVLREGGAVRYRLPMGVWRDLWTGKAREGGVTVNEIAPLNRIPVFVRDGALLPMGPAVSHTGELTESNRIAAYVAYGDAPDCAQNAPVLCPEIFFDRK